MIKVIDEEIHIREKEYKTLYDLYSTRYDLHIKGTETISAPGIY